MDKFFVQINLKYKEESIYFLVISKNNFVEKFLK